MARLVSALIAIILVLCFGIVQEVGYEPVNIGAVIGLSGLAGFFTGVLVMALALRFDNHFHPEPEKTPKETDVH